MTWLGPVNQPTVALVLAFCWLPLMIMCFPGNLAWDSGVSMLRFLGLETDNHNNPYFQDFLMGAFYSIGSWLGNGNTGVLTYCLLQTWVEIALLTHIITDVGARCRDAGYALLALYAVVPVFPLFAFTMVKDASFAIAVMAFVFLALRAVRNRRFWQSPSHVAMLSLTIVLMGLLRNHAGWVPAIAFVLYAWRGARNRRAVTASLVTLVLVCLSVWLPSVFGMPRPDTKESMSIPLQTMAYYAKTHPDDISAEDRQVISAVIDYDTMLADYQAELADPIKDVSRFNGDTTGPFMKLWLGKLARHPLTILKGWWMSTNKYLIPGVTSRIKPHALVGYDIPAMARTQLGLSNTNPHLRSVQLYDALWLRVPGANLLVTAGLYSLALLAMLALILWRRVPGYLFCVSPLLMVLIGCLLSPVNGYYRYAFSMVAGVPIVLTDLLLFIRKQRQSGKAAGGKRMKSR